MSIVNTMASGLGTAGGTSGSGVTPTIRGVLSNYASPAANGGASAAGLSGTGGSNTGTTNNDSDGNSDSSSDGNNSDSSNSNSSDANTIGSNIRAAVIFMVTNLVISTTNIVFLTEGGGRS